MGSQNIEVKILTIQDVIKSDNIDFLLDCKDFYEEIENYRYCAKIRDRLIEIESLK